MTWLLEVYAAAYAGFGFLAHNYAQCSSTQILQMVLVATAAAGAAWIGLRASANERMRRRLLSVIVAREPTLAAALERAQSIVQLKRPIECYWSEGGDFQLATLGYFQPSLIIGRRVVDALAPEELEAALAHELMHARRRDALRVDLGRVLFALLSLAAIFALILFLVFYVGAFGIDRPLALSVVACSLVLVAAAGHVLIRHLERRAEFACDRAAAAGQGGALATAAALVKVAQLEKGTDRYRLAAAVPLFSAETFQLRVRRLIDAKGADPLPPKRRWQFAGVALLSLSVAAVAQPPDMKRAAAAGCVTCELVMEKSAGWTV
ncbi:MAG: M56 family metallopeptidase [Sphingomicrobium sp.]